MTETEGKYEQNVKPLKICFLITTALVLVLATTIVILKRNHRVLEKTNTELVKAFDGLERVKDANLQRKQSLAAIKAQLAGDIDTSSPENRIYGKIDEITSKLKPDDMTITTLEKKGGNLSLHYTIKFINPQYSVLLNAVSQLQHSVFPFSPVNTIAISQTEQNGKGVLEYTISGSVMTPERAKP